MVEDVFVFVDWIPLDIQVLFGSEMPRTISLKNVTNHPAYRKGHL